MFHPCTAQCASAPLRMREWNAWGIARFPSDKDQGLGFVALKRIYAEPFRLLQNSLLNTRINPVVSVQTREAVATSRSRQTRSLEALLCLFVGLDPSYL